MTEVTTKPLPAGAPEGADSAPSASSPTRPTEGNGNTNPYPYEFSVVLPEDITSPFENVNRGTMKSVAPAGPYKIFAKPSYETPKPARARGVAEKWLTKGVVASLVDSGPLGVIPAIARGMREKRQFEPAKKDNERYEKPEALEPKTYMFSSHYGEAIRAELIRTGKMEDPQAKRLRLMEERMAARRAQRQADDRIREEGSSESEGSEDSPVRLTKSGPNRPIPAREPAARATRKPAERQPRNDTPEGKPDKKSQEEWAEDFVANHPQFAHLFDTDSLHRLDQEILDEVRSGLKDELARINTERAANGEAPITKLGKEFGAYVRPISDRHTRAYAAEDADNEQLLDALTVIRLRNADKLKENAKKSKRS